MSFESARTFQRTERGLNYDRYVRELKAMANSSDPKVRAEWQAANEELRMAIKASASSVHVNPVLQNLAVLYHNDALIGTRCMPVVMTDGQLAASYFNHDSRMHLGVQDDTIAEGGLPNQVDDTPTTSSVTLVGRALSGFVAQATINNATEPMRPLMNKTKQVLNNIDLAREARIATMVTTSTNYGANTTTLTGTDRWNGTTGGDPAAVIDTGIAATFVGGPGTRRVGVCDRTTWNYLKRHPRFLGAGLQYVGGSAGDALRMAVAEWLELDEILVAGAVYDAANEGQTASYSGVWASVINTFFAVLCVADDPMIETASFGYTFQDAPAQSEQIWKPERGSRGAFECKIGFNDVPQVVGALTSYLVVTPCG